jgi:hypothetical protein
MLVKMVLVILYVFLGPTVAICAGPILFLRALRDFRLRRLIQSTPRSNIASMAMGLVEIEAEIVPTTGPLAPLPNISPGSPFFVSDDTGIALVLPKGAEFRALDGINDPERILVEGERVFVLGTVVTRSIARDVSHDAELAATGTDDGRERRVRELHSQAVATISQGDSEVFIISQQSERDVANRLTWASWAKLIGGLGLALFGLHYWLLAFVLWGRLRL